MKTCYVCKQSKPIEDFYRQEGNGDGLQGHCKECNYAKVLEWRARNPERWRANQRRWASHHRFWDAIRSGPSVQVKTEDDLRVALKEPYPFYAEPRR